MGWNTERKGYYSLEELEKEYLLQVMRPGDLLVYSSNGLFGWIIKLKTSMPVTHVATYVGNGKIREAREQYGVQEVEFDSPHVKNLVMIRRPRWEWNAESAFEFFQMVEKWEYDYWGLVRSFVGRHFGVKNTKVWCSEYRVLEDRASGGESIDEMTPADAVSPGDLVKSPAFKTVWQRKDFKYGLG